MCLAHVRICRPPVSQDSCSYWPTACSQRSLTCSTRCLVDGVHEGCWMQASVRLMLPASQDAAAESRTQASSASGIPWARADSWPEALQHCIFRLPSDSENPGGFLNLWHTSQYTALACQRHSQRCHWHRAALHAWCALKALQKTHETGEGGAPALAQHGVGLASRQGLRTSNSNFNTHTQVYDQGPWSNLHRPQHQTQASCRHRSRVMIRNAVSTPLHCSSGSCEPAKAHAEACVTSLGSHQTSTTRAIVSVGCLVRSTTVGSAWARLTIVCSPQIHCAMLSSPGLPLLGHTSRTCQLLVTDLSGDQALQKL